MKKFKSKHVMLEVIAFSRPLPAFLNRQIISLLSARGVSDSVFESMQVQKSGFETIVVTRLCLDNGALKTLHISKCLK